MRALLALALASLAVPATAQQTPVPTPLPNVTGADGRPRGVTPTFPLNVGVVPFNCSGTIAVGGTAQTVLPNDLRRQMLLVENPVGQTGTLYVEFGAAATTTGGAVELAPGGSLLIIGPPTPTTSVSVLHATTGARVICKASS